MITHEKFVNDLIESLKISSAYRQQQEHIWRERAIRDYAPLTREDITVEKASWH
jgi:hypothetical protein